MKNRYARLLVVAAAAGAIAIAGCGDDDDEAGDSGASETALTEGEFVERGNAICAAGDQEVAEAGQKLGQRPSQAEVDAFVTTTLVPLIQGQLDSLSALAAPEEIAADVDAVIADAQEVLDQLEADPSLIDDPQLFDDVDVQLTALGLTDCVD